MDFYAWIMIVAMASFFIGFLFGVLFTERNIDVAVTTSSANVQSLITELRTLIRKIKVSQK